MSTIQPSVPRPSPSHPSGPPARLDTPTRGEEVTITAWVDPLVDDRGHAIQSAYVEQFWIAVLGPTATWVLRRLAAGLDQHPDGYRLDPDLLAQSLGLSHGRSANNAFGRAFSRCVMFGLIHQHATGYSVRRKVPDLARRHLTRLPATMQEHHARWIADRAIDDSARATAPLGALPLRHLQAVAPPPARSPDACADPATA